MTFKELHVTDMHWAEISVNKNSKQNCIIIWFIKHAAQMPVLWFFFQPFVQWECDKSNDYGS